MNRGIFRRAARGFTMVTAIFILVVLAALGAAIVTVSTSQQIGSALDVQGARAYQAARAGLEWGLYQRARNSSCTDTPGVSFTFPDAPTLSDFTVTVICKPESDPGGFGGPTVYVITATACSQANASNECPNTDTSGPTVPGNFYIERRLEVLL